MVGQQPAHHRRLVLGMRVTLEPPLAAERKQVTVPLLEGRAADTRALAEHVAGMRQRKRKLQPAA